MPAQLNESVLLAAIEGFESQKTKIDQQIAELRTMLPGSAAPATSAVTQEAPPRKRRKMSAAGRKAIAEAQRKRWAASRVQAEAVTPEPSKSKRRMSAAGRKAISEATKRRWAMKRAEAARAEAAAKKPIPARKKTAKKKAALKKAVKKAPVAKKTPSAPAPAPTAAE